VDAGCSTLATICFVNALRHTTVADVNVIYATAPFIAATLQWVWTGERESSKTLAASGIALLGVTLMVDVAISAGHFVGDLLAFLMTVLISVMMVIIRNSKDTPMLPAASLSAFASAIVVLPLASPGLPAGTNLIYLFLFGTTQFGLGLLLLTLGTRLISATKSA
jgi:drug/metabolite transporter (DMT)-like permease